LKKDKGVWKKEMEKLVKKNEDFTSKLEEAHI